MTSPIDLASRTSDEEVLIRLAAGYRLDRLNASVATTVLNNPAATVDVLALCRGDRDVVALDGVTYVGGAGVDLEPRQLVILVFGIEEVHLIPDNDDGEILSVPVDAVTCVDLSGPGRETSGGGFVGGGFGLEGALEGMAIASVLNSLATRERIKSFIRLAGPGWEAIFLHGKLVPGQLRHQLSVAVVRAEQAARDLAARPTTAAAGDGDLVFRLERLANLLDRRVLTQEDYNTAKARVLAGE